MLDSPRTAPLQPDPALDEAPRLLDRPGFQMALRDARFPGAGGLAHLLEEQA